MKRTLKVLAALLLAVVMLSAAAVTTRALPAPVFIGDVDDDNSITIMDASRIQRWLAELEEELMGGNQPQGYRPQKYQEYIGDINRDGSCDILDASYIQRFIAGYLDIKLWDLSTWAYYIEDTRLYADYNSGKARVGVPVTFHADVPYYSGTANPDNPTEPYTYEFLINGEVVQERSENTEMTYTFTEAGSYKITAVCYNALDCSTSQSIWNYQVVEPYSLEKPVIVSTLYPDDTYCRTGYSDLHVRAEGGDGGYQYKYTIDYDFDGYEEAGWTLVEADEPYKSAVTTGYIDSNALEIPNTIRDMARDRYSFEITVQARDSQGNESEPVKVLYYEEILIG